MKGKLQDCFVAINYCNEHAIATRLSFKIYSSYYKAMLKYWVGNTIVKINIVTNKLYIREKNCTRFIKCDINKVTRYLQPNAIPAFIRKAYHV
nr:MAG TPA: hypothetical protein [Caudoviricetes sp.]